MTTNQYRRIKVIEISRQTERVLSVQKYSADQNCKTPPIISTRSKRINNFILAVSAPPMDSSQNQCDSSFTENRKVKASRLKYSSDDCNLRPSWWLPMADTNTTKVPHQITKSLQTESADGIYCRDQLQGRSERSASTSETGESFCNNNLNQESDDSVNGESGANKEAVSHDAKWEIMFDRLLEFKKKYGHCLVPNRYKEDHKLGSWVSTQRKQYKALACGRYDATTLPAHRIKKLDEIGFAWNTSDPRRVDWEVRYSQLKEFFHKYGM
jgi:Helicase associated domain